MTVTGSAASCFFCGRGGYKVTVFFASALVERNRAKCHRMGLDSITTW